MKAMPRCFVAVAMLGMMTAAETMCQAADSPLTRKASTLSAMQRYRKNHNPNGNVQPTSSVLGGVITQDKAKNTDILSRPVDVFDAKKLPTDDIVGRLRLKSFTATRNGQNLTATAVLSNTAKTAYAGVQYTLSTLKGNNWVVVKTGVVSVNAQEQSTVVATLPATRDALTLKFDMLAPGDASKRPQQESKQFNLAAKSSTFVVRYSAREWTLAGVFNDDNSKNQGADAQRLAMKLQKFGFETQRRSKHEMTPFEVSYRVSIFIRTAEPIEQTFPSWQEAVSFRDSLRALVPSKELAVEDIREL